MTSRKCIKKNRFINMKKIICVSVSLLFSLVLFTACGSSSNSMESCTFTWTDEDGVGIGLNAVTEEWVDDGREEALEYCPICLNEWDMDIDEPFDEYVAKCDHWNDCVAVHSSEDESIIMKVYEGKSQEGYRDCFSYVDGIDVKHEEVNGKTFDYGWFKYDIGGSNEYYTLVEYVHNEDFNNYYLLLISGIYSEEDAEEYAKQLLDSVVIVGE